MDFDKTQFKRIHKRLDTSNINSFVLSTIEKKIFGFLEVNNPAYESDFSPKKLFSLDSEFIKTSEGPEIVKITLVDENEKIVFNEFIKVKGKVVDFLTKITGINEENLGLAKMSLEEAEKILINLCSGNIIVGHDLMNDLNKIKLGPQLIIDTVLLYQYPGGPPGKYSLSELTLKHLRYQIQTGIHSSDEDAIAALRLTKHYLKNMDGRLVYEEIPKDKQNLFEKIDYKMVIELFELEEQKVLCMYVYGSRALGTSGKRLNGTYSDWDIAVVIESEQCFDENHMSYGNIDLTIFDRKSFEHQISKNIIWAFETIFTAQDNIWMEKLDYRKEYTISKQKIRTCISWVCSNRINKGKRDSNKDLYIGFKSIFIALRYYFYGTQYCQYGYIKEFRGLNHVWKQMRDQFETFKSWEELYSFYKPILKEYKHKFSEVCPFQSSYKLEKTNPEDEKKVGPKPSFNNIMVPSKKDIGPKENLSDLTEGSSKPGDSLEVISYLRKKGLEDLCSEFKIKIKRHENHTNLVQLHYSSASDFSHVIPRQCRGIILEEDNNWNIICIPYFKFFDYGDKFCELGIDWDSALLYEKIDGSIATLYFYKGEWHVSSSSFPDGSAKMCFKSKEHETTMEKLFWTIFKKKNYKMPSNTGLCYIFEVISVHHIIIVEYENDNLILHGVRDMQTLQEIPIKEIAIDFGWEFTMPLGPIKCLEDAVYQAAKLDGSKSEGFVICDRFYNRIKVKSQSYVKMNWMFPICPTKLKINDRHFLTIIKEREEANFIKYCPEYEKRLMQIKTKLNQEVEKMELEYATFKDIEDKKSFAIAIAKNKYKSFFFQMKLGFSAQELLLALDEKKLENMLMIE